MPHWLDFLFPPRVDEKALRDISPDEFLAHIAPRLAPMTRPGTIVLLSFSDTLVRAAIHEAKYHGSEHAFTLLSLTLADYLQDFDDDNYGHRKSIILVPVPLGKERRKERGYNQAEEVAKRAARELDIVVDASLLERTRETSTQVSLDRDARERNMRGAFKTTRPADPARTYILVDDVLTTGATLQAAVGALHEAGAENIIPLALAH
ncbi:MAG: phosphoribosyltransferase family protein [Candidatus Paceibacterota bacterium]|jgi:ComF family protein